MERLADLPDPGELAPMERLGVAVGVAVVAVLAVVLPGRAVTGVDLAAGPLGVAVAVDAAALLAGVVSLSVGCLGGVAFPSVSDRVGLSPRPLARSLAVGPLATLALAMAALVLAKAAVALGDGVGAALVALVVGLLGAVFAGAGLAALAALFVVVPALGGVYAGVRARQRVEGWLEPSEGRRAAAADRTPQALARAALLGRPRPMGADVSVRVVGWWAGVAATVLFALPLFVGPLRAFAPSSSEVLVRTGASAVPGATAGSAAALAVGLLTGAGFRAMAGESPRRYRTRLASAVLVSPLVLSLLAVTVTVGAPMVGDVLAGGLRTGVARVVTALTRVALLGGGISVAAVVLVGLPTVAGVLAGDALATTSDAVRG